MKELRRLLCMAHPYKGWMTIGILLSLITLLANIGLLAVSGWFIASMALAGAAGVSMNYFTPAAIIRGLAITRTGGRWLERVVTHEATLRLLSGLRVWFYEHLEPLAPAGLQQHHSGDLLSRLRADIDTLDRAYLGLLVPLVAGLGGVTVVTLVMGGYGGTELALVNLALLLLAGLLLPAWVLSRAAKPGARGVQITSQLRSTVVDGLQGLPELLVYGRSDAQAGRIDELGRDLARQQRTMSRLRGVSSAAVGLSANLSLWLVLLLAIPMVGSTLEPAELAMVALLAMAGFEAVAPLPEALRVVGEVRAAARRLFEVVDTRPPVVDPAKPAPAPEAFDIQLSGVKLRYAADQPWALDGIDLDLPAGSRTAITGPTASGKSSLSNLLLRFWDYQYGSVTLGGRELRDYRGEDVRGWFAVVSQHSHLFNTTIRANLQLAQPEADDDTLFDALRRAQALDFVQQLPDGLNTFVGEAGLKLSGGQARRIAIARALLKDAPILILDEPTEGLDTTTASELMTDLEAAMAGRTMLLISHRDEGIASMDRVLRMQDGQLVAGG